MLGYLKFYRNEIIWIDFHYIAMQLLGFEPAPYWKKMT